VALQKSLDDGELSNEVVEEFLDSSAQQGSGFIKEFLEKIESGKEAEKTLPTFTPPTPPKEKAKPFELKPFYRTPKGCFKKHASPAWGTWYKRVDDPSGEDVSEHALKCFYLTSEFPKVPLSLVRSIVSFYRHYITQLSSAQTVETNEVQVCLLREEPDYKTWRALVPRQVITAVSVDSITRESCDLISGEEYEVFPPDNTAHAGSSHSHNTMNAFFSPRDDAGELNVPGLHFVIGRITKTGYHIKASIVLNRIRYIIDPSLVLDLSEIEEVKLVGDKVAEITDAEPAEFHEKVHTYVSKPKPTVPKTGFYRGGAVVSERGVTNNHLPPATGWKDDDDRPFSWTPGANKGNNGRGNRNNVGFNRFENALNRPGDASFWGLSRKESLSVMYTTLRDALDDGDLKDEIFVMLAMLNAISLKDARKLADTSIGGLMEEIEEAANV
jgi:hypothetical protein